MSFSSLAWIIANAIGFAGGFGLFLSISDLLIGHENMTTAFWGHFIGLMTFGLFYAFIQSLVLRRKIINVQKWIIAGLLGFILVLAIIWPFYLTKFWPTEGPIEPLVISFTSCALFGLLLFLFYKKELIGIGKFFVWWLVGVFFGILISALLMMFLISNLGLHFIAEMAIFTLIIGAVAGIITKSAAAKLNRIN